MIITLLLHHQLLVPSGSVSWATENQQEA